MRGCVECGKLKREAQADVPKVMMSDKRGEVCERGWSVGSSSARLEQMPKARRVSKRTRGVRGWRVCSSSTRLKHTAAQGEECRGRRGERLAGV